MIQLKTTLQAMRLKSVAFSVVLLFGVVGVSVAQPVITNVTVDIAPDSAIVTVTTDVASTVVIDYGTDTNYGSQASDPTLATSHDVVLSGLSESTLVPLPGHGD